MAPADKKPANAAAAVVVAEAISRGAAKALELITKPGATDADKGVAIGSMLLLLGQLAENQDTPAAFTAVADSLPAYIRQQGAEAEHLRKNACALLTGLVSTDEALWQKLVVEHTDTVPTLVQALHEDIARVSLTASHADAVIASGFGSSGRGQAAAPSGAEGAGVSVSNGEATPASDAFAVNLVAALTAAAAGGEEGASAVIHAGALPLFGACTKGRSHQLQEAVADALAQLATAESLRAAMLQEDNGAVLSTLAWLIASESHEVRVRSLLCLGMLLPGSPNAQLQFVKQPGAVQAILANISSNQDQDCQVLGRQLLQLVSSGHPDAKQAIATALRAGPPEPIPASA